MCLCVCVCVVWVCVYGVCVCVCVCVCVHACVYMCGHVKERMFIDVPSTHKKGVSALLFSLLKEVC